MKLWGRAWRSNSGGGGGGGGGSGGCRYFYPFFEERLCPAFLRLVVDVENGWAGREGDEVVFAHKYMMLRSC